MSAPPSTSITTNINIDLTSSLVNPTVPNVTFNTSGGTGGIGALNSKSGTLTGSGGCGGGGIVYATPFDLLVCNAGTTSPTLSVTSLSNVCPTTTVNLSSITANNTPTSTTLTWFSSAMTSAATQLTTLSGLSGGTYYAAFYDATNVCYGPTTSVMATVTVCSGAGTIDCSKTKITPSPVAGKASQMDLIVTVNVTAPGPFPLTVSGSGMSLANGYTTVTATTTGIQTFHIPLNYSGTALSTLNFTVGSAGSCTADLTKTPKKEIVDTWTLDCVATVGPTLR